MLLKEKIRETLCLAATKNDDGDDDDNKGLGKMTQWIGAFVTEPDNVSLILRTHMVEGENQITRVVLWAPLTHHGTCDHM